ncbi:hypothetical protein GGI35DRAFT_463626 [Trichoderma velutinum]
MFVYPVVASLKQVSTQTSSKTKGAFNCTFNVIVEQIIQRDAYEGWHVLADGRTVVTGYPITQRNKFCSGTGALETPLFGMVRLLESDSWDEKINRDGNIFLKGPQKALIPIDEKDNTIIWSVILNHRDKESLSQAVAISPLGQYEGENHRTYNPDESKRHFIELTRDSCRFDEQPNQIKKKNYKIFGKAVKFLYYPIQKRTRKNND